MKLWITQNHTSPLQSVGSSVSDILICNLLIVAFFSLVTWHSLFWNCAWLIIHTSIQMVSYLPMSFKAISCFRTALSLLLSHPRSQKLIHSQSTQLPMQGVSLVLAYLLHNKLPFKWFLLHWATWWNCELSLYKWQFILLFSNHLYLILHFPWWNCELTTITSSMQEVSFVLEWAVNQQLVNWILSNAEHSWNCGSPTRHTSSYRR